MTPPFLKLFLRFHNLLFSLFLLVFVGENEGQKALQLIFAFESTHTFKTEWLLFGEFSSCHLAGVFVNHQRRLS